MIKVQQVRWFLGVVILFISLIMLAWGIWPTPTETRSVLITSSELQAWLSSNANAQPDVSQPRRLKMEWPIRLRRGESNIIRLVFENNSTGQSDENSLAEKSEVNSPKVIVAEGKLDMVGMEYLPSESVSMPIHTEKPVVLLWNIRGVEEGVFRGTVWLHLILNPGTGDVEERKVVSAQMIETQVVDFWGLSGKWARVLGSIGVVLGVMLLVDMFIQLWDLFPTIRSGE